MTKQEHIDYWIESAKQDWRTVQNMYKTKDYLPALFFSHLCLEKFSKALWVKNNAGNTPPKIHNLVSILKDAGISFSTEQLDFMNVMNNFQLQGRYPDYQFKLHKTYKGKNTDEIIKQVKQLSLWLQRQL